MVIAAPAGLRITDFWGKPREHASQRIDWSSSMAEKGGYRVAARTALMVCSRFSA